MRIFKNKLFKIDTGTFEQYYKSKHRLLIDILNEQIMLVLELFL